MTDEIKKADLARQERLRQQATEKAKPKDQESEFDKLVKSGQMQQRATTAKAQQKPVTEQAIHESAKKEQREQETRRKERDDRKEKKDSREEQTREGGKITDQKVVGKGSGKQGGHGAGGEGRGGYQGSTSKRGLSSKLSKAGVKTLPADLQKKFAAKLVQAQQAKGAGRAELTQQVLDKIVQYVRIGMNRAGEKEIQIDLHERIFRGLKLRVTAQGGKVGVHLRTSDARGREVFKKNRDRIMAALTEKGIEVEEMRIT